MTTSAMGPTTLFSTLNVLDGSVISPCQACHRHIEWLKFLKQIDSNIASDLQPCKGLRFYCDAPILANVTT